MGSPSRACARAEHRGADDDEAAPTLVSRKSVEVAIDEWDARVIVTFVQVERRDYTELPAMLSADLF